MMQKTYVEWKMCCLQFGVAQVNNTALAAQAQPQPVTPWSPSLMAAGSVSATAVVSSPASSGAFKSSWFSGGARWCKPSDQDAVAGPGEPFLLSLPHCTSKCREKRETPRLPAT